jgi:hypothetical protein
MGFGKVSRLSLIYCEPGEDLDSDNDFKLSFSTHVEEVEINPNIVPELLIKARNILNADIPEPVEKCIGICSWIERYSDKMKNLI